MPASPFIELTERDQATLMAMAKAVISHGVKQHELQLPEAPALSAQEALHQEAASFVSLYVEDQLRGCTGTCEAYQPLWQDVCEHAYSSAFSDGRFHAIEERELASLSFHISILSPMIQIENEGEQVLLARLNVGKDGLMLQQGSRRAVFIPSVWRSLKTPEAFVSALKHKGSWPRKYWSPNLSLYVFQVAQEIKA